MKRTRHISLMSRTPEQGQTLFALKLEATTEIIDRLIVVPRQIPFKAGGPTDDVDNDADNDNNNIDNNNNNDNEL